jgi:hypothetical protein
MAETSIVVLVNLDGPYMLDANGVLFLYPWKGYDARPSPLVGGSLRVG